MISTKQSSVSSRNMISLQSIPLIAETQVVVNEILQSKVGLKVGCAEGTTVGSWDGMRLGITLIEGQ